MFEAVVDKTPTTILDVLIRFFQRNPMYQKPKENNNCFKDITESSINNLLVLESRPESCRIGYRVSEIEDR